MSDPRAELLAAFERRAGEVSRPAPLPGLVARATRRRRRSQLTAVTLAATLTASAIVGGVAAAGRGTGTPDRPARGHGPRNGVSAQQVAHGRWSPIPAPPRLRCGGNLIATGGTAVLLSSDGGPGCPKSAAMFSPSTDTWTQLGTPPTQLKSGYWQAAWNGSVLIVVANDGAVAQLQPRTGLWSMLSPPEMIPGAGVVATPHEAIVLGLKGSHTEALAYDGTRWTTIPNVPAEQNATAYLDNQTIWVFTTEGAGKNERTHVYRLDGNHWVEQPRPTDLPLTVQDAQQFGTEQLVTGQDCPSGYSCAVSSDGPHPVLTTLGTTQGLTLPSSPFFLGRGDVLVVGRTIIQLSIGDGTPQQTKRYPPGTIAAYNPQTARWLTTTRPPPIQRLYSATWTTHGLVEIGPYSTSCHCGYGGAILHPDPTQSATDTAP